MNAENHMATEMHRENCRGDSPFLATRRIEAGEQLGTEIGKDSPLDGLSFDDFDEFGELCGSWQAKGFNRERVKRLLGGLVLDSIERQMQSDAMQQAVEQLAAELLEAQ